MAVTETIHAPRSWVERVWRLIWKEYKTEGVRVQVARERIALLQLTDRELRDIGITRADALREAQRSYYDVPQDRIME